MTASLLEIAALWCLAAFYLGFGPESSDDVLATVNFYGPLSLAVILVAAALYEARRKPSLLFLAPFWFRISTAMYFGLGNLITYVASDATVAYVMSFHPASLTEMRTVNLVVALGAAAALTGLRVAVFVLERRAARPTERETQDQSGFFGSLLGVTLLLGSVGFLAKYLLLLPWEIGLYPGLVLPGVLISLNLLPPIAIFLATLWASERGGVARLSLAVSLVALECLSGIMLGNKSTPMLATLMFVLGFLATGLSLRKLVFGAGMMLSVFAFCLPITDYLRERIRMEPASAGVATISQRMSYVEDFFAGDSAQDTGGVQGVLVRLSYANQAAFAVAEYEIGRPGDSYRYWLLAPIPRAIWPDKPNISALGTEFNARATGNEFSGSSPGLAAEAYWNFGFAGVVLMMAGFGFALYGLGRYGLWVLEAGRWWHLPIALLAMRVGLRSDGYFVLDVLGPICTIVVLHIVLTMGMGLVKSPARRRRRRRVSEAAG